MQTPPAEEDDEDSDFGDSYDDEAGVARLFAVGYLKGIRETVYSETA